MYRIATKKELNPTVTQEALKALTERILKLGEELGK